MALVPLITVVIPLKGFQHQRSSQRVKVIKLVLGNGFHDRNQMDAVLFRIGRAFPDLPFDGFFNAGYPMNSGHRSRRSCKHPFHFILRRRRTRSDALYSTRATDTVSSPTM